MNHLPCQIAHVGVPPIKCQGIKTKLVPFILGNIEWGGMADGRWIEPFLGSGVVAFNLAPQRALLTDVNHHIIHFYQAIQSGQLSCEAVRDFLVREGGLLSADGVAHYYRIRERFNREGSPFDFLFLNRSCFNGVMRFNRKGEFNVPFGHKPQRFAPAYITKIVNQIGWVAKQMRGKNWEFRTSSWEDGLDEAQPQDFVYLDPPYIGRHTDYFQNWTQAQAVHLACRAQQLPCGYALSMWHENRYRKNLHIQECWSECEIKTCEHFYHVGSREDLRNGMQEALVIKRGHAVADSPYLPTRKQSEAESQLRLALEKRTLYQA